MPRDQDRVKEGKEEYLTEVNAGGKKLAVRAGEGKLGNGKIHKIRKREKEKRVE